MWLIINVWKSLEEIRGGDKHDHHMTLHSTSLNQIENNTNDLSVCKKYSATSTGVSGDPDVSLYNGNKDVSFAELAMNTCIIARMM